ncbi:MAG: signal peptidase I [Chlorobiaceae bacterium]|nr:signal peptidase I [Chlorobiaceae bacterium]
MNKPKGTTDKGKSREWFEALIIAALVATVLRLFVVESYRIPTGSMERTLLAGDFLFVNKYVYGPKVPFTEIRLPKVHDVRRGDIIVFKFPKDRSLNYIKRCVALPGDMLEIRQRRLFINGEQVRLPQQAQFIGNEMPPGLADFQIFPSLSDYNKDNYGPIRVPRKGDVVRLNQATFPLYRDLIADEGHEVSMIGARVYVDGMSQSTYTVGKNYYFAMGDNRDNSLDSRYWGFLPESDVVGQALMVYWSWDPDMSLLTDPVGKVTSIRWGRTGLLVH